MIRPFLILAPVFGVGAATTTQSPARTSYGRPYDPRLFSCPVVRVHDGDTSTCAGGTRIRRQAIDAPEIDICRGHGGRWVSGDGYASRDALRDWRWDKRRFAARPADLRIGSWRCVR